jgi:Tfp pilus assembly protein PilE
VAIIGLLASIAVPSFKKARLDAQRTVCIQNLNEIDAAKERWALENRRTAAAAVDEAALNGYFRRGAPECPGAALTPTAILIPSRSARFRAIRCKKIVSAGNPFY